MAKYKVIGAGATINTPIEVNVECESAATICWIGRTTSSGNCNEEMCSDEMYCSAVTFTDCSTIPCSLVWKPEPDKSINVYYRVVKDCKPDPSTSCSTVCSDFSLYTVPKYVDESYSGDVTIHYLYTLTCEGDDGYIGSRTTLAGIKTENINAFTKDSSGKYTYDFGLPSYSSTCSGTAEVFISSGDICISGESADVSITFYPDIVPALPESGTDVTVVVKFKKTVIDSECNKKITNGTHPFTWHVKCTPGTSGDEKLRCCKDHMVSSAITLSDLRTWIGIGNDAKITYNGAVVPPEATVITYSILQRGKYTDECVDYCDRKTTYCVDSGSVQVFYETEYMSNIWVNEKTSQETGCDCSTLTIDGYNGYYAVPYDGGRIKVTWDYSAHTTTDTCAEYDTIDTWEEIIAIGGCNDRPTDCDPEYNTVIDAEGHTAVFDNKTFCLKCEDSCESCNDDCDCENLCESCDAECCYNYDGKGTCRCVILFKEQTPGCTSCDSETIYDSESRKQTTYNKIHYEFVQDCTKVCDYTIREIHTKEEKTFNACDSGEFVYRINYTKIIEYQGEGCPAPVSTEETKIILVDVTENFSPFERVIYNDEWLKVTQKGITEEDPCYEHDCDCNNLTIE